MLGSWCGFVVKDIEQEMGGPIPLLPEWINRALPRVQRARAGTHSVPLLLAPASSKQINFHSSSPHSRAVDFSVWNLHHPAAAT